MIPTWARRLQCFYSILVRLKVLHDAISFMRVLCFYSILVRLKGLLSCCRHLRKASFYSILVRLKVGRLSDSFILGILFLFHTGSIKSDWIEDARNWLTRFLFHTGSIKRSIQSPTHFCKIKFLFHTGSIKSYCSYHICSYSFSVSIPYWFD